MPAEEYNCFINAKLRGPNSLVYCSKAFTPIQFQAKAKACELCVRLSAYFIDFGRVFQGQKSLQTFTIDNYGSQLPFKFEIEDSKFAFFRVQPSTGVVGPCQKGEVKIHFFPRQLGVTENTMIICIYSVKSNLCLKKITISVKGECRALRKQAALLNLSNESELRSINDSMSALDGESEMIYDETVNSFYDKVEPYDRYIQSRRENRVRREIIKRSGVEQHDDFLDLKKDTQELLEEWRNIDALSGLNHPTESLNVAVGADRLKAKSRPATASKKLSQNTNSSNLLFELLEILKSTDSNPENVNSTEFAGLLLHDKKFKKATTGQSRSDLLSHAHLSNIFVDHNILEFGEITNFTSQSLYVKILNYSPEKKSIFVEWNVENDKQSMGQWLITPKCMVIPPDAIGFFRVSFSAHCPSGYFSETLKSCVSEKRLALSINQNYGYSIGAKATIIPIQITLDGADSKEPISLVARTQKDAVRPFATKTIRVHNNSPNTLKFRFLRSSPVGARQSLGYFDIEPLGGLVEQKSSVDVTFRYVSGLQAKIEERIDLSFFSTDAANESDSVLHNTNLLLQGSIDSGKCSIVSPKGKGFEFGALPVCPKKFSDILCQSVPHSESIYPPKTIRIKNSGTSHSYFWIQKATDSRVFFYPEKGVIAPHEEVFEVNVWVVPPSEINNSHTKFEENISVFFSGSGKSYDIPITFEAHIPSIQLVSNSCHLKTSTAVGGTEKGTITLLNTGTCSARIVFDLRMHEDFHLISDNSQADSKEHQFAKHDPHKKKSLNSQFKNKSTNKHEPQDANSFVLRPARVDELIMLETAEFSPTDRVSVLELAPSQKVSIDLVFKPKSAKFYSFDIPFSFHGQISSMSGDVSFFGVEAQAVDSGLRISRDHISFSPRVVSNMDLNIALKESTLHTETFHILNEGTQTISWWLESENLPVHESQEINGNSKKLSSYNINRKSTSINVGQNSFPPEVFKFDVSGGRLLPGERTTINVVFSPQIEGYYAISVPIYVDIFGPAKTAFTLELSGFALAPALSFYPPELFVPTVPLGIEITASFTVCNHGFSRNELGHVFSEDLDILLSPSANASPRDRLGSRRSWQEKKKSDDNDLMNSGSVDLMYPEGKILKNDGEELVVTVKFRAPKVESVGFTTQIQFFVFAPNGEKYSDVFYYTIHIAANNCLLSLWSFVSQNLSEFTIGRMAQEDIRQPILLEYLNEQSKADTNRKYVLLHRVFRDSDF